MEIVPSAVPFSYMTVVATKSRIEKGLLALPVGLVKLFPDISGTVHLLSEDRRWEEKSFTSYDSSSRECRIGGMREFYDRYNVRSGDQLVLCAYEPGKYQILPESLFHQRIIDLEAKLDNAQTQIEADIVISELAEVTNIRPDDVIRSEYVRLAKQDVVSRKVKTRNDVRTREHVPPSLRKILTSLYHGRCQVSGFSFLKNTGEPYFEVHHINPFQGNHVKNVLVVSPNVHAQFTYAAVDQAMDESGWLRQVRFNGESHSVFQIVDKLPDIYEKEVHFT